MNKKFYQLDNKAWLIEQRREKTLKQIALEIGCKPGSLRWALRNVDPEIIKKFKYERVHTKKKR